MTKLRDVTADRPPVCPGCHLPFEEGAGLVHCLDDACDELTCAACRPTPRDPCPACKRPEAEARRGVFLCGSLFRWKKERQPKPDA